MVRTPAEARAVIDEGKLAVILGIEASNLFDCFSTPHDGFPLCDDARVIAQLDRYHALGVRAIFPVHKYDNGFSAGDGDRPIGEIGGFINSGHWSSYTLDCPNVPVAFDRGDIERGGLNMPRPEFTAPPPNDMSGFAGDPVGTLVPFLDQITGGPLRGEYCATHGLTPIGETLLREMMRRGMIIEVDHLPQRSYHRAFEMLAANEYPVAATQARRTTAGSTRSAACRRAASVAAPTMLAPVRWRTACAAAPRRSRQLAAIPPSASASI